MTEWNKEAYWQTSRICTWNRNFTLLRHVRNMGRKYKKKKYRISDIITCKNFATTVVSPWFYKIWNLQLLL